VTVEYCEKMRSMQYELNLLYVLYDVKVFVEEVASAHP
jgi:hypothetical protein